jgi:hypothetical protein
MAKGAFFGMNKQLLLMVSQVAVFLLFLLYLTLVIPAYSTARAFYGLSLVIPLSLAFGLDEADAWLRARNYQVGGALYGWLGTLAVAIVLSYTVHAT